jgi:hypothetical protein
VVPAPLELVSPPIADRECFLKKRHGEAVVTLGQMGVSDHLQRVGQAPFILGRAGQLRGLQEVSQCQDRVGWEQAGSHRVQAACRGGGIAGRLGPRTLIAVGMLIGGGGMAYLTQLTVTSSYAGGVLPALLAMGLGFGMIFSPAINTATTGVARQDSGVASALVNTMQQVGGSIGTAALSTVALTATATYLAAHHARPLAPATAAVHGYTMAFTVSAALLGLGALLTALLVPSKSWLEELRNAPPVTVDVAPAPSPALAGAMSTQSASPSQLR